MNFNNMIKTFNKQEQKIIKDFLNKKNKYLMNMIDVGTIENKLLSLLEDGKYENKKQQLYLEIIWEQIYL